MYAGVENVKGGGGHAAGDGSFPDAFVESTRIGGDEGGVGDIGDVDIDGSNCFVGSYGVVRRRRRRRSVGGLFSFFFVFVLTRRVTLGGRNGFGVFGGKEGGREVGGYVGRKRGGGGG